jgi:uncharacterized protein (DUF169 family)
MTALTDRIGISILNKKPDGLPSIEHRVTHCTMVSEARKGRAFYAEDVNYSCGFAIYTLGLGRDVPAFRKALAEDLVSIKNAAGIEVSGKLLESTPRLPEGEKYIVFFPLEKMPMEPDIVVIFGKPSGIMDLVWRITGQTGERLQAHIGGIGATCSECTAQTVISGKPNLSLGCCGTRRFGRLDDNEIMLSLPWKDYKSLILQHDRSPSAPPPA